MPIINFDDFQPGSTIKQPGNPQEGSKGPAPSLGASAQPFQPERIEPTSVPQPSEQAQPEAPQASQAPQPQESQAQSPSGSIPIQSFDSFTSPPAPKGNVGANPKSNAPVGTLENPSLNSPLHAMDRIALSVGDKGKGAIDYLKKRYEGAVFTEEQGLLIKDQGTWHKADPYSLSDVWSSPWEMTKQMVENNIVPVSLNAAGYALGSPLGYAGVAGGGMVSGLVRTSFGRYLGTYESTPKEQVSDIGVEAFMNLGGKFIELGVAPKLKDLIASAYGVKQASMDYAEKMVGSGALSAARGAAREELNSPVQNVIANSLGATTQAGPEAINTIIDEPARYGTAMSQIAKSSNNSGQIQAQAVEGMTNNVKDLLENASKALPQKFGEALQDIKQNPNISKLQLNGKDFADSLVSELDSQGYGKVVKNRFIPFSIEKLQERAQQGLPTPNLTEDGEAAIESLYKVAAKYSKVNTKGPTALDFLRRLHGDINAVSQDTFKSSEASQTTKAAVAQVSDLLRNSVGEAFDEANLGKEYAQANQIYSTYANAVANGRNVLESNNPNALQAYTAKLFSKAGKSLGTKSEKDLLIDLTGDAGKEAWTNARVYDAVSKTANWAPKLGVKMTILGGMGAEATHSPLIALAVGAPALAASSPRVGSIIARTAAKVGVGTSATSDSLVNYGFNMLNYFRAIGQQGVKNLLQQPDALNHVLTTPGAAALQEQQDTKDLLQKSGAIPNGQQQ